MTTNYCKCGKRISQYATKCKKCHEAKMSSIYAANIAIVQTGKCPVCGESLKRNLSITGWWQCEQHGAEGFRKHADKPACTFECFTE